jgi:hypothetical protein
MRGGQSIWLVVCHSPLGDIAACQWCEQQTSYPARRIVAAYIAEDVARLHARLAGEEAQRIDAAFDAWIRTAPTTTDPQPDRASVWDPVQPLQYGCTYDVVESRLWLHPDQYLDHTPVPHQRNTPCT